MTLTNRSRRLKDVGLRVRYCMESASLRVSCGTQFEEFPWEAWLWVSVSRAASSCYKSCYTPDPEGVSHHLMRSVADLTKC